MNKLTEDQDKKLQDVIEAISAVGVNDVTDDIKRHIDAMHLANKRFKASLPFTLSDDQLSRLVSNAAGSGEWVPKTILEHDLLLLLRALHKLDEASSIYQLYIRIDHAKDFIDETLMTSSLEYSDDEPQFEGKPVSF